MKPPWTMAGQDVMALHSFLSRGSFVGRSEDLAHEMGMSRASLWQALREIRSVEHLENEGWTIAYVHQGAQINTWALVTRDGVGAVEHREGDQGYRRVSLGRLQRQVAHFRMEVERVDARTSLGRELRRALAQMEALVEELEALVEMDESLP